MMTMPMNICRLHEDAIVPAYATPGASAFDFHSITSGIVSPYRPLVCDTGIAVEVPENMVLLVFSRSGHGFKIDVRLANCVGVIDSDYTGSIKIKLTSDHPKNTMRVEKGDRIGQGILMAAPRVSFNVVDELGVTDRGSNGFGSTGQ